MASCPISDIADFQSNVQLITYVLTSEGHCPLADEDDNSINGSADDHHDINHYHDKN